MIPVSAIEQPLVPDQPRRSRATTNILPGWHVLSFGSLAWGGVMAASAALHLQTWGWQTPEKFVDVAIVFGAGGMTSFSFAVVAARLIGRRRAGSARFAAVFLALAVCTIGFTAAFYAVLFRSYYAQWHDPAFSADWFIEQVFTIAGALAQFAVSGLRLYFPIGFAALAGAATWLSATTR